MSKAKYIAGMVNSSGDVTNTSLTNSLDLKAPLASPTFTGTVSGVSKSMVGLGNVDNTTDLLKPISTATQTALNLKANQSTTYTKTEADAAISNLVAAAPGALDTLNELATALGNDPNFATTVTNSIALKAPLASPTLTGTTTAANLAYTGTLTGSTGILNIGSGQLYKDASGNVGIGTTSPSGKLGVVTTASTAAWQIVANNNGVNNGTGIYADASNNMQFAARDGSGVLRVVIDSNSSTNSYINSGNVGIGTSSPPFKLSVAGDSFLGYTGSSGLLIRNLSGMNRIDSYNYPITATYPLGILGSYIALSTSDAERMRIDPYGNVGIGTSSPSTYGKLAVNGNIALVGSGYLDFKDSTHPLINKAATASFTINPVGGLNSANPFWLGFHLASAAITQSGTNVFPRASHYYSYTTVTDPTDLTYNIGTGNAGALNHNMYIYTNGGSGYLALGTVGTERMRINSSGNVGIGTSSPACKLNVYSSTAQNDAIGFVQIESPIPSSSVNVSYTAKNYSGTSQFMQWENYGLRIGSRIVTNTGLGNIIFTTGNDAERMRIDSSGNVGIGTSSPSAKLQIGDSTVNIGNRLIFGRSVTCAEGHFPLISHYSDGSTSDLALVATSTSGNIRFFTGNSTNQGEIATGSNTEKMRIDSSGNVGIGTASNAGNTLRYLDIQNTDTGASAGAIIRLVTNNSASTAVTTVDIVKYKNGLFSINNNDTGQIALNIAGSNRLYINSGESMILRSTVGSTAAYDMYHTNINGMSLAVNRFTSSNGDIGDWPTPVLAIKGYDSNFNGITMQTFGSRDDNAGYQTGSAIWNIRLWNDAGGTWTTSNSSTAMELKGPGPYRIQAGASNGVQLINGATSWTTWSDENMKDIIEPITDALQKVSTLRTVIGKYKKEADGIRRPFLIAQDVEKVLPEAVTVSIERDEINPDDIYAELEQRERLLLSYTDVIPLLTAAIKELKAIIDTQQEQINSLLGK